MTTVARSEESMLVDAESHADREQFALTISRVLFLNGLLITIGLILVWLSDSRYTQILGSVFASIPMVIGTALFPLLPSLPRKPWRQRICGPDWCMKSGYTCMIRKICSVWECLSRSRCTRPHWMRPSGNAMPRLPRDPDRPESMRLDFRRDSDRYGEAASRR